MGTKIYIYISFYDQHDAYYGKEKPAELPPEPKRVSLGPRVQNRLYVFGEKEEEGMTFTDLPELDRDLSFPGSSFCVVKSSLFFVGGNVESVKVNGILSLKLGTEKEDPTWKQIPPSKNKDEFHNGGGTAVFGDLIYAIGWLGGVYVFDTKNIVFKRYLPNKDPERQSLHSFVGSSDSKMYVNFIGMSEERISVFGFYDVPSLKWNTIHHRTTCLYKFRCPTVVIREKYLIYFEEYNPRDVYFDSRGCFPGYIEKFRPGLYVYDILGDKWLEEPVKKFPNDGIRFPSDHPPPSENGKVKPVFYQSVMQVRGEEFAFVWCTWNGPSSYEFHVTRFRLKEEVVDDAGTPPTFSAEDVRAQHFNIDIPILEVQFAASPSS